METVVVDFTLLGQFSIHGGGTGTAKDDNPPAGKEERSQATEAAKL